MPGPPSSGGNDSIECEGWSIDYHVVVSLLARSDQARLGHPRALLQWLCPIAPKKDDHLRSTLLGYAP